ncbi:MAG TPA: hypothetical protein VLH86_02655 [Patescibacteria group bacterium]|nr:hypothetical protein [Patescibacteria group bacterium]
MSQLDMGHPSDGTNAAMPSVVLALDCSNAQRYLNHNNEVLQAACPAGVVRLDVSPDQHMDLLVLLKPLLSINQEAIIRTYRDLSYNALPSWVAGDDFLEMLSTQLRAATVIMAKQNRSGGGLSGELTWERLKARISVVLVEDTLAEARPGSRLSEVLFNLLPWAAVFKVKDEPRGFPERIWYGRPCPRCHQGMDYAGRVYHCRECKQQVNDPLLCNRCGEKLRPAGSALVCEECGQAYGQYGETLT